PIFFPPEDIDGCRQEKTAGRQGDATHHVEGDPDSPWLSIGKIGDRSQPAHEARDAERREHAHQGPQQDLRGCQPLGVHALFFFTSLCAGEGLVAATWGAVLAWASWASFIRRLMIH